MSDMRSVALMLTTMAQEIRSRIDDPTRTSWAKVYYPQLRDWSDELAKIAGYVSNRQDDWTMFEENLPTLIDSVLDSLASGALAASLDDAIEPFIRYSSGHRGHG